MLAKFEFNLPEDEREYEIMSKSLKTQSFLWEFSQQLRAWYKYGHSFKDGNDALSQIRDEFYRLLNQHEVNIDL
jgi:hypothetical protein